MIGHYLIMLCQLQVLRNLDPNVTKVVNDEWWTEQEMEGHNRGLLRNYQSICVQRLRKLTRILNQDSQFRSSDPQIMNQAW
jgi:hypothetical protein